MLKYDREVLMLLSRLGWLMLLLGAGCRAGRAPESAATPELTATSAPAAAATRAIVLGDIAEDPGVVIEGTQPLADYMAAQLADFGITEGRVKIAATTDEMADLLEAGEVDLYFDSVYPATLVGDASGGEIILRRWRYGVEVYHTVIFAGADQGIDTLQDLRGHIIAFDNPFSTSGYFLPAVSLLEAELPLVGKSSYEEPVAEDEVGFVFSYHDENTLQWVFSGLVAAGATDDYNYEVLFSEDVREQLVVLKETAPVPRQVVVVRPNMAPALLEAVKSTLTTAHESEAGQAALEPFQTSRFDEFPEGIEAAQRRMREMMEQVQGLPLP